MNVVKKNLWKIIAWLLQIFFLRKSVRCIHQQLIYFNETKLNGKTARIRNSNNK